ncbi:ATP-binding cassette domain-containing protein [Sphingobacterium thalpophilum]|uniref:Cell division ATP-binding protein FtsE n=1 Tax=Sphingobacterium thalpophilum TaxID=259 RepID=A0A4U9W377_9SPHI|nr:MULTISPECIES: ATP-binding cassette domain-containing protein [Sphingobacterium]MCW8311705.1 ATP-binding cassette domain-containing protein [Sphingobacterium sp. InxBP1]VTR53132.1 Cell division ATP-binding protein FtsE [Sphingobacterium thalpophilum]
MIENKVITLKNVDIFQQKHLVLSNVNLSIGKGEFIYLIGQSGSGKSSLLKIIYGDLYIGSGEGMVAGFDLKKLHENDVPFLRRKLGIVFQDFHLLSDRTIEKNLEFALKATGWKDKKMIDGRILDVLEKVGLRSKLKKMPHELSGGEQQRIVIARALLNNPEIILADEPTGNLDPATSEEIVLLLRDIANSGTAILMATHDYTIIRNMPSRIIKTGDGVLQDNVSI